MEHLWIIGGSLAAGGIVFFLSAAIARVMRRLAQHQLLKARRLVAAYLAGQVQFDIAAAQLKKLLAKYVDYETSLWSAFPGLRRTAGVGMPPTIVPPGCLDQDPRILRLYERSVQLKNESQRH